MHFYMDSKYHGGVIWDYSNTISNIFAQEAVFSYTFDI